MEKKHCGGCGKDYWPNAGWQHEKCPNLANMKTLTVTPEKAVKSVKPEKPPFDRVAYQREYMRKRREKK